MIKYRLVIKILIYCIIVSEIAELSIKGSSKESVSNKINTQIAQNFDYTKPIYLCKVCSILLIYEGNWKTHLF